MKQKVCSRCVMDTTDKNIVFDKNGVCNHCHRYDQKMSQPPFTLNKKVKEKELQKIVKKIRKDGRRKQYDCIIGISGGTDSSYLLMQAIKLGLRPLAVHMDNGWNSELAVMNIENMLRVLDVDLYTYVLNWEEFRNLQLSFLKASVPDLEIPTDLAIKGALYKAAVKFKVKHILSGYNPYAEGMLPTHWSTGQWDWHYVKGLQKKYGTKSLRTFTRFTPLGMLVNNFFRKIKMTEIYRYIPFHKKEAMHTLKDELGWRAYGDKHGESTYTRFVQSYVLPEKFGYDKRKAHLSMIIRAGHMKREDALTELKTSPHADLNVKKMKEYVAGKFDITLPQLEWLLHRQNKHYSDYPNYDNHWLYPILKKTYKKIMRLP